MDVITMIVAGIALGVAGIAGGIAWTRGQQLGDLRNEISYLRSGSSGKASNNLPAVRT